VKFWNKTAKYGPVTDIANDQPSVRFDVRLCTNIGIAAAGCAFPVSKCNRAAENAGSLNRTTDESNQRSKGGIFG
jgi:hypothetical protein